MATNMSSNISKTVSEESLNKREEVPLSPSTERGWEDLASLISQSVEGCMSNHIDALMQKAFEKFSAQMAAAHQMAQPVSVVVAGQAPAPQATHNVFAAPGARDPIQPMNGAQDNTMEEIDKMSVSVGDDSSDDESIREEHNVSPPRMQDTMSDLFPSRKRKAKDIKLSEELLGEVQGNYISPVEDELGDGVPQHVASRVNGQQHLLFLPV